MLLLFSVSIDERPPVWERVVYSVCLCAPVSFGFEVGMWDLIV